MNTKSMNNEKMNEEWQIARDIINDAMTNGGVVRIEQTIETEYQVGAISVREITIRAKVINR